MTQIVHAGRTETDVVVAYDIRWEGDLSGARSVTWSRRSRSGHLWVGWRVDWRGLVVLRPR